MFNVVPFSKLDNTNFLTTITGKNYKFMTISKEHNTQKGILIDRLNDALNLSSLKNVSTYFNVHIFNEHCGSNSFNGFNILHFNIYSL